MAPAEHAGTATMVNGTINVNSKNADTTTATPNFPPPKTDKPRPHVCTTCGRSFARLEHLKRHERSHTKEKPFECPQCARCFARRDLLLRHQQKLHQTGSTSSRPRGRRESASGAQTGARGRKNSIASSVGTANNTSSSMRPRANTISHIDMAAFNSFMNSNRNTGYHGHHGSLNGYGGHNAFDFRSMSNYGHHGNMHGLPKLDTNGLNLNIGGGLRTAPILGDGFDFDKLFGGDSTINPAQLHHFQGTSGPLSAFQNMQFAPTIEDEDSLDWTGGLGETLLDGNGEAITDGSSPSAISTASHNGFNEVMMDGSNHHVHNTNSIWNNSMLAATNMANSSPFPVDPISSAIFPELVPQPGMMQNGDMQDQSMTDGFLYSTSQNLNGLNSTAGVPGIPSQYFQQPMAFDSGVASISSPSANGSSKHSSMTSISTDSITDATRQALIFSLSQSSGYSHTARSYSHSSLSSPLSPGFGNRVMSQAVSLPSTADLQRYVSAYIHYFHPHMPFLHIPTLTFDTPAFTSNLSTSQNLKDGIAGGGGCLILAMAAIGASYEFEHIVARELFESSKRMIKLFLDERRIGMKASMGMTNACQRTPTWLVQAMLLNLIYGHQCGDKMAAETASIQCAALISLAKAAELDKPDPEIAMEEDRTYKMRNSSVDVDMSDEGLSPSTWGKGRPRESREEYAQWFKWKSREERKRTLYSVFVLSSLLVTAYHQQPRILNSEIQLELPCEEDLWAADNVQAWHNLGGRAALENKGITFADALTYLLTASQRQPPENRRMSHTTFGSTVPLSELPASDLKPSTFGCYVLINALHVYIWETRQRHTGRQWKPQETEQMHAHIEPALRAWQAAWKANPHHNLERPNPYGPLPADSIPLLDLAYVRLFVNLGRSKEAFWNRDFEAMAKELGEGNDIIQHANHSRGNSSEPNDKSNTNSSSSSPRQVATPQEPMVDASGDITGVLANNTKQVGQTSKRERHLRKAAFYAADSLAMADRLGVTFAEFTSRELPIQSAICTFDCAQVLAEWIATVQERVGRFLGIIGRDDIDYSQVPAIMLLEEEDVKLIRKINEILNHAEVKIAFDAASLGTSPEAMLGSLNNVKDSGDGSKILLMTAYMLNKAAVWGITKVMSQAMHVHATVLKRRAEASLEA